MSGIGSNQYTTHGQPRPPEQRTRRHGLDDAGTGVDDVENVAWAFDPSRAEWEACGVTSWALYQALVDVGVSSPTELREWTTPFDAEMRPIPPTDVAAWRRAIDAAVGTPAARNDMLGRLGDAQCWHAAGFDPVEAVEWTSSGFTWMAAKHGRSEGWAPGEARRRWDSTGIGTGALEQSWHGQHPDTAAAFHPLIMSRAPTTSQSTVDAFEYDDIVRRTVSREWHLTMKPPFAPEAIEQWYTDVAPSGDP